MHLTVLASGSGGNSALIRAGETSLLVDAGLTGAAMETRLEAARLGPGGLGHVLVTHAHLDHARSAGKMARQHGAMLHCPQAMMSNASVRRAKRLSTLPIGPSFALEGPRGERDVEVTAVNLPHDCSPTVAFRFDQGASRAVILTDMGHEDRGIAVSLAGANVLVLEFNHDERMLETGPYPWALKRRIAGPQGHLSNTQAARMLQHLASERLHTLVLAHLSATNNTAELALEAAHACLDGLGLAGRVRVLVASQDETGEPIAV